MSAATIRPLTTAIALSATALLMLTGCSGNGGSAASGTYYGERGSNGDPAVITVDGNTVTWGEFTCDNVSGIDMEDSDTSIGTLDKTRTTVAWTQEGNYYNTDPFTESEDGSVITMSGGTYSRAGSDAGDAILAEREQECADRAEAQEKREAAQAEQADADAKMKPAFDKTLDALFDAAEAGNFSDAEAIFEQNGITPDEFAAYLERNYNGLYADELFGMLQESPDQARMMLEELSQ
ncbi:hypothetical protein [Mycetocola reblochoni]|uniref:hypothetical protein n=1 Tax=Mycetocola reblochoni TaxID=331618 RepID=UPI003F95F442